MRERVFSESEFGNAVGVRHEIPEIWKVTFVLVVYPLHSDSLKAFVMLSRVMW